MTITRSQGRKKSNFPGAASIPSDATLDFVKDGVNYKITYAEFLAGLGVTGSITQLGAPTSTPVLDIQGSVNRIRNIADGSGVKAFVNANNGVTLGHAFKQDNSGAALLKDITSLTPTFASLTEGTGINISVVDNKITIGISGAAPATDVVSINVIGDFPDPVSGIITLEPSTVYLLTGGISTSNRFILQEGTAIVSYSHTISTLEYVGAGTMFTCVDANIYLSDAKFSCPNGTFVDMSETVGNTKVFSMAGCVLWPCLEFGTVDGLSELHLDNNNLWELGQGIVVAGSGWNNIRITRNNFISLDAAFIAVNITGAVMARISVGDNLAFAPAGSFGIKGDAASANISAGGLGTMYRNAASGGVVTDSGIDVANAIRWKTWGNEGVADTRPDGLLSMQGNAVDTVISASSTDGSNAVLVAGVWKIGAVSHMTGTTAGRLTSNGERDVKFPVTASVSLEPKSGTNVTMSAYIALNGVIDADSKRSASASAGYPTSITIPWQLTFAESDFAEVYIENNDNATDLLASSGILRIN